MTGSATTATLITDPDELARLCDRLRAAGTFGLDIEFSREKTYFPRLELVQAATDEEAHAIDPLALRDLGSLWDVVTDPDIETVLHSATQDLEVVYRASGRNPRNIFDTQIAAALLGYGEQVPFGQLVKSVVGADLSKLQTRSDWARRPLSAEQIDYALDDVRHLVELRRRLGARLAERGRERWAAEEMIHLEDPATYVTDPAQAFKSVKGHGRLSGKTLGALRELAAWREREAQRRDLPKRWVVPDDALLDVARRLPKSAHDLDGLRRLSPKILERHSEEIFEAVRKGAETPVTRPEGPRRGRPDDASIAATDFAVTLVRLRADETGVAASYLAGRDDVMELVEAVRNGTHETEPPALLRGWRKELVGAELVELVRGRLSLRFDPDAGSVVVSPEH